MGIFADIYKKWLNWICPGSQQNDSGLGNQSGQSELSGPSNWTKWPELSEPPERSPSQMNNTEYSPSKQSHTERSPLKTCNHKKYYSTRYRTIMY